MAEIRWGHGLSVHGVDCSVHGVDGIVSSPKTPDSVTKTAKKEKKAAKSPKYEDGVTPNSELYKMILLALQGKAPLQHDGNGKVHIGNGVWISEKTWDDKIRKANVSPSIAVRDVMSKIYTPTEMAERSLEGATPVKPYSSGQKIKKKKMTPQKTEAVLGVYRAKTVAASGSEDPFFLDLAVSKKGKDTFKYKLKEAASALKPKD
ncbi:uncharacterized protein LOC117650714 [Thrips palmi]|uniref:Uncharacterized protein LOC117650714 n=1 Tax=Thrips palmi TaxID=161013 RepID=A0A6P8ZXQ8_THRPL|nr:uncharacterized protein LOC117650714 [Thrips palmi]